MFASAIREERRECRRKIGGVMIVAQYLVAGDDLDCDLCIWIALTVIPGLSLTMDERF